MPPFVQLPLIPKLTNGIRPPPTSDTDVTVTVEPMGNCVCGLKEPLVLCAAASGVAARKPAKAKSITIPAVLVLVIFCINFTC